MYADKVGGLADYAGVKHKFIDNFTRGYDFLSIRALTPHKKGVVMKIGLLARMGLSILTPAIVGLMLVAGVLQDVRRNAAGADCY